MTQPFAIRFCPSCGTARKENAPFCEGCGFKLTTLSVGSETVKPGAAAIVLGAIAVGLVVALAVFAPRPAEPPATVSAFNGAPPATSAMAPPMQAAAPQVSRERIEEVLSEVRAGVEAEPEAVEAWMKLADGLYRASGFEPSYRPEAREAYERVLELEADRPEALVGLGNLAYDEDEHDVAIGYYQAYLEQRPDDPNVRTDLGTMYLYAEQPDAAIAEYTRVLELKPEFVNARFNLANAHHVKGDREKATAIYNEVLATPGITPQIRSAVQQLLARLEGRPAPAVGGGELPPGHPPLTEGQPPVGPATAAAPPAPSAAPAQGSPAQREVQELLAKHPIFGPKIVSLSWDTETRGQVWVQQFPMDQMPAPMRASFLGKIGTSFGEIRSRHGVAGSMVIEIIDQDTGAVMETLEG